MQYRIGFCTIDGYLFLQEIIYIDEGVNIDTGFDHRLCIRFTHKSDLHPGETVFEEFCHRQRQDHIPDAIRTADNYILWCVRQVVFSVFSVWCTALSYYILPALPRPNIYRP